MRQPISLCNTGINWPIIAFVLLVFVIIATLLKCFAWRRGYLTRFFVLAAYERRNPAEPLHKAAFRGNVAQCRALLASGTDINATDKTGATPLHAAHFLYSAPRTATHSAAHITVTRRHNGQRAGPQTGCGRDPAQQTPGAPTASCHKAPRLTWRGKAGDRAGDRRLESGRRSGTERRAHR